MSVAQTVFANKLLSSLRENVPGLDPEVVTANSAAGLRAAVEKVGPQFVPGVLSSYNDAVTGAIVVAVALSCLMMPGALATEWKSVKGEKKDAQNDVEKASA